MIIELGLASEATKGSAIPGAQEFSLTRPTQLCALQFTIDATPNGCAD